MKWTDGQECPLLPRPSVNRTTTVGGMTVREREYKYTSTPVIIGVQYKELGRFSVPVLQYMDKFTGTVLVSHLQFQGQDDLVVDSNSIHNICYCADVMVRFANELIQ
jgi:hypothetical protein